MGGDDKNSVLVDGMSPVTSKSEGTVVGFADVCKTPGPGGPVPIPYPNIARSSDLKGGSRTVSISGAPVCLSSSSLGTSTGNEAATAGGGVASGKTKGAAHPANYSFSVKIEGKPVVRNLDLFTLNDRNTPPFPIMQPQVSRPVARRVEDQEVARRVETCPYCKKAKHAFGTSGGVGSNLGSSAVLGRNILEGRALSEHPWYAGPFSLAAHHLICLEALDGAEWAGFCRQFIYHPDRKQNGVLLPMRVALACQLRVAVHRGNHAEGFAYDLHLPYPRAVMARLREIANRLERGAFCSDPGALVRELDALSAEILEKVARFTWTLTRDGLDYQEGGVGCAGVTRIPEKPDQRCPTQRRHRLNHAVSGQLLAGRVLKVGE
jgi:hypothetical protein